MKPEVHLPETPLAQFSAYFVQAKIGLWGKAFVLEGLFNILHDF